MTGFRQAFPDLNFWGTADLTAEGDHVVARWEGGGTHTGPAFSFLMGSLPAATGRKMHLTGTTVLRLENGKVEWRIDCSMALLPPNLGARTGVSIPNLSLNLSVSRPSHARQK